MGTKKIKILRIINRFNLGGPTYNVAYLSKYLPEEYETMLVGGAKDDSEASSDFITNSLGLQPLIIDDMRRSIDLKKDWRAYRKIKKIIREFQPDIVHTHASKAGTLGRLAAFSCNVPVVVHTFHGHVFHSYFGRLSTFFYKTIERYLAKRSTKIIAISEKQKQELALEHKICAPSKIEVIPLGFDLSKFQNDQTGKRNAFRNSWNFEPDEFVIVVVGRLVPVKNHTLFLDAFKIAAAQTHKKIRACIVGDGECRNELENRCTELGLSWSSPEKPKNKAQVVFCSWIQEVDFVLAGCDLVALSSFNEGTPVSLIEAQAAQKPIVSTRVGGIENSVIPDVTARLVDNFSPDSFAAALLLLVENDGLRAEMSLHSWDFVREKFHFTRLVRDVDRLYKQLLSARSDGNLGR